MGDRNVAVLVFHDLRFVFVTRMERHHSSVRFVFEIRIAEYGNVDSFFFCADFVRDVIGAFHIVDHNYGGLVLARYSEVVIGEPSV